MENTRISSPHVVVVILNTFRCVDCGYFWVTSQKSHICYLVITTSLLYRGPVELSVPQGYAHILSNYHFLSL